MNRNLVNTDVKPFHLGENVEYELLTIGIGDTKRGGKLHARVERGQVGLGAVRLTHVGEKHSHLLDLFVVIHRGKREALEEPVDRANVEVHFLLCHICVQLERRVESVVLCHAFELGVPGLGRFNF